jgi:galactitol-specific phosphotransferase system IIC component
VGVCLLCLVFAVFTADSIVEQIMKLFHVLLLNTPVFSHESLWNMLCLIDHMIELPRISSFDFDSDNVQTVIVSY